MNSTENSILMGEMSEMFRFENENDTNGTIVQGFFIMGFFTLSLWIRTRKELYPLICQFNRYIMVINFISLGTAVPLFLLSRIVPVMKYYQDLGISKYDITNDHIPEKQYYFLVIYVQLFVGHQASNLLRIIYEYNNLNVKLTKNSIEFVIIFFSVSFSILFLFKRAVLMYLILISIDEIQHAILIIIYIKYWYHAAKNKNLSTIRYKWGLAAELTHVFSVIPIMILRYFHYENYIDAHYGYWAMWHLQIPSIYCYFKMMINTYSNNNYTENNKYTQIKYTDRKSVV